MTIFRKSLSEDPIDCYNHTWAFLFLLFLSLVTLFIPISPALRPNEALTMQGEFPVRYQAICWCPNSFTGNMVAYTYSTCSAAANQNARGKTHPGASVISVLDEPIPREEDKAAGIKLFNRLKKQHEELVTSRSGTDIKDLIWYKTPLYLFLLAICLKLPIAFWSLLSICFGNNIDKTLSAIAQSKKANNSDISNGTKKDIAKILRKSPKKNAGVLYLLMKFFVVVVVCIEIVIVSQYLLGETENLERGLDNDSKGKNQEQRGNKSTTETEAIVTEDGGFIGMCFLPIMQLNNVQNYVVQCLYKPASEGNDAKEQTSSSMAADQILLLYKAMFTVVLASLIILAIFNICSFASWVFKLTLSSCRSGMGLPIDAPMDTVFLVSMAWCNTSSIVAMEITQCCSGVQYRDGEKDQLHDELAH